MQDKCPVSSSPKAAVVSSKLTKGGVGMHREFSLPFGEREDLEK